MNMSESFVAAHANARLLENAVDLAVRAVPPMWPLSSSVAVNPFLGQSSETLAQAGARLARVAGAPITPQRSWFRAKIAAGEIRDADLLEAWKRAPADLRPANLEALKAAAQVDAAAPRALPTIADLAADCSGVDWPGLIADRFGAWAAGYFDEGQALWAAPRGKSAFTAWRATAMHDLTPEIAGLSGFARHAAEAPDEAMAVIARVAGRLGLEAPSLETAFHRSLMTLGGWAQYARWKLWQAELAGGTDQTIVDLLAIRLIWEEALFLQYEQKIGAAWARVREDHAAPLEATPDLVLDEILLEAAERASQLAFVAQLTSGRRPADAEGRPRLQAAFCIDVRSEVFRRALESMDPQIRTLGFAGFFGLAAAHRRFASDTEELRLPVLLNPALRSCSGGPETGDADRAARIKARAKRAWGRFKLAAVSSFAFVEATGPIYAGKLVADALGLHSAPAPNDPAPRFEPALDLTARVNAAAAILRAMSLTSGFAPLVLLVGHGANVVNNPHASGLHCGACGGYSGEVNARLLASLLNDRDVRASLALREIFIPEDTLFVGALHDTTTDRVTLYEDVSSAGHIRDLVDARGWLAAAGVLARGERALRLPRASGEKSIRIRSRDWAETRPEWALAGCKAFIAAPRARTSGTSLHGRAFLHDYDWKQDASFSVLELILTAPVVVASWISLQYYASTVAPDAFGGGNKLLHNVVGGIGVVEGNGGILRAGLPWQSVHTGAEYAHKPLRLSVYIEAPREAIIDVLRAHDNVRALFDNGWLHLFAIGDEPGQLWRYTGDFQWIEGSDDALAGAPMAGF